MMNRSLARFGGIVLGGLLFTGCAGMNRPRTFAYPALGQNPGQQADDHSACEAWARQQTGYDAVGNTVAGAVGGTLVGASIGALLGAIICAPIRASGTCAGWGAAAGAARGGVEGAAGNLIAGRETFSQAYGACMAARGYATAGSYNSAPLIPVAEAPEWCRRPNQEYRGGACITKEE